MHKKRRYVILNNVFGTKSNVFYKNVTRAKENEINHTYYINNINFALENYGYP